MANRREKVTLELEDYGFSTRMIQNAAATGLLERALKSLDGTNVVIHQRISESATQVDRLGHSSANADKSINQLTGRLELLGQVAAILGPSLIPLGGVGLAGVAALVAQLSAAALAGGVLIGSLQGVGDALGAMHDAQLEPTAENLAELEKVMDRLSPAAREFAREAYGLLPTLKALRDAGADALFPGLVDSIGNLELLESEITRIMQTMGRVVGNMASDVTESLASDRWAAFFDFLADEGPQAVRQLTKTVGSLTHGLAELWMAFDPLNDDAGRWMKDAARDFDEWATKLDETEGFQNFVEYLRTTGPQVADALGALGNALVQVLQAAAPLGGPVLQGITAVADTLAAIADSPVGPTLMAAVTAMALLARGTALYDKAANSAFNTKHIANIRNLGTALDLSARNQRRAALSVADFAESEKKRQATVRAGLGSLGKTAGLMGGLALASSGAADSIGLTNTMSLALMGTMAGPWGAAVGAGVGLMLDFAGSQRDATMDVSGLRATLDQQTGAITENTRTWAANELEKAGALKTGQEIGLSLSTITDAALGNAEAMAIVQEATAAAYEGAVEYSDTAVGSAKVSVGELGIAAMDLRNAVGLTNDELGASQAAIDRTAAAADEGAESFSRAESRVEAFTRAVGRLNRLLSGRASLRDYEQALDDFTASIKENGDNWDIATEKGRNNQAALDDIVGTTLKVAEGLKGANRQRFLSSAIGDLKDMASRFNVPQTQTRQLIRLLREANGVRVKPIIEADTVRAMTAIQRVRNALAGIKDKSVTVRVTQTGATVSSGFGPDYYTGGFTGPGGRLEPRGVVHAGEVVIPQDLVRRDWSLLSQRYGHLPGFADGGVVGSDRKDGKKKPTNFAGGLWMSDAIADLIGDFGTLGRALRLSERAVDRETRKRDDIAAALDATKSAFADLASATTDAYNSNPFEDRGAEPTWKAGGRASGVDPIGTLQDQIAYGQEQGRLQAALEAAGLGGKTLAEQNALAEVLRNADNTAMQALLDNGQVQQLEDLLIQRASLVDTRGNNAGQAVYGQQLVAQTAQLADANGSLREATQYLKGLERIEDLLSDIHKDGPINAAMAGQSATGSLVSAGNNVARRRRRDRKH